MGIEDELNEMSNVLSGNVEDTPTGTGDVVVDDPKVEDKVDADGNVIKEVADVIDGEGNIIDKPTDNADPNVQVDDKDAIIEDLRKQLNEKKVEPKPDIKKEPEPEPKIEPLKFDEFDFVGDTDPYEVMTNKESLNKLLNTLYAKGVNDAKDLTSEGVLRSIPDIVKNNIQVVSELKKTSDAFYSDNKDLAPFKRVVATVFEEVASANPDKGYGEVLKDVGVEVRKRLNLYKKTIKDNDVKGGNPKLPTKSGNIGTGVTKPDATALEQDIAAMNSVLGGN